jgi:UDP-GlcNAc:undecaprenyl-phosphate GlcNAc-1-phosphate transferase
MILVYDIIVYMMINMQFILTFILSYTLSYFYVKYSSKVAAFDIPNSRSIHKEPIPNSAGIVFVFSFLISFLIFNFDLFIRNIYIFLAIFIVFLLGVLDDYKNIIPRIKLIGVIFASCLLYPSDIQILSLGNYFGIELNLWFLAFPFTVFAISGFTNALNLIDGLDGLSAGLSIVILTTFAYIGVVFHDNLILQLSIFTIASLGGFLIFNWSPAKIFMGDSGSLSLGFIISIVAILSLQYIHPVVILYLVALPLIDTLIVMIRRIKTDKSPFRADKTHIHHILYDFFDDTKTTVVFLILLQSIFCFLGYVVARHIESYPNGLFPIAMVVSFIIIITMAYMIFTTIINKGDINDNITK